MICKECGKDFPDTHKPGTRGRKKEFCSDECRRKFDRERRALRYSKICEQCGKEFTTSSPKQKFCCRVCSTAASRKGRTVYKKACEYCGNEFETIHPEYRFCSNSCASKHVGEQRRGKYYCEYCGKPRWSDHPNRNRYCSPECARKARSLEAAMQHAQEKRAKEQALNKQCVNCGKTFRATTVTQRFCSEACQCENASIAAKERGMEEYVPREFICAECGRKVITSYGVKNHTYCSQKCMMRAGNRRYHHQRKQLMQTAYIEPVALQDIYNRANGVCEICGLPVPDDTTPENAWGATRDHIVPLSKGGLHEMGNCQLAHRICNSLKLDSEEKNFRIDWKQKLIDEPGKWNKKLDALWEQLGEPPPGPPMYPKIQFPRGTVRPFL